MIVGIIAFGYMLTATNHKVIPSVMLARCAMNAIDLSTAGRGILHDGCKYPSPACAIVRDCLCRAPHGAATYPMAYWCDSVCAGACQFAAAHCRARVRIHRTSAFALRLSMSALRLVASALGVRQECTGLVGSRSQREFRHSIFCASVGLTPEGSKSCCRRWRWRRSFRSSLCAWLRTCSSEGPSALNTPRKVTHCCHPPRPANCAHVVFPLGMRCVCSVRDGTRRCGPSVCASIHRIVTVAPIGTMSFAALA